MKCSFYFCSPSLDITKNSDSITLVHKQLENYQNLPSSKRCKQRHQRRKEERKQSSAQNFKNKVTQRGPRKELWSVNSMSWFLVACHPVHKPLGLQTNQVEKGSGNFINTLQINVPSQDTFQRSSWENVGRRLWSMPQGSGGLIYNLRTNGKNGNRIWLASQPQNTTTNPISFQRLVFCGSS